MVNLVLECKKEKAELKEKKWLERQVSIVSNTTKHYRTSCNVSHMFSLITFVHFFLLQGKGIKASEGERKKHEGDDSKKVPQTGISIMMNTIKHFQTLLNMI